MIPRVGFAADRRCASRGPAAGERCERIDVALYAAIARTPTPALDRAMARLSHAADYSRLSLASATILALRAAAPVAALPRPVSRRWA